MDWTAEKLSELATGYWGAQAVLSAIETGVIEALPGTAAEVCTRAGVDVRVGGMLLEALVAMQLLVRDGDRYDLNATARPFLTAKSPTSMVGAMRFNSAMYAMWAKLGDVVKSGQPAMPPGAHLGDDPARTRGFVMGMHSRGLALLPAVADAIELGGAATVLDVGSGAGTLGRMLAERNPTLRVTLLDLPGVTDVARGLTQNHPAAARVTHLAADYLRAPLPGPYDAVVHCGALHQHDSADAAALVRRLAGAVHPGGRVVIVDLLAGPAFSMLFALNMALVSPKSRMHSVAEVRDYLAAAGVSDVVDRAASRDGAETGGGMYRVVSGVKR